MATKLLKAALFAQVGAACNCFGNGACTNNECQCDAGWKGPDCATLDVLPAAAVRPGFASRPNWGAAQLQEGSSYYTFVGAKRNTSAEGPERPFQTPGNPGNGLVGLAFWESGFWGAA